jgi:hypothetical protein
MRRTPILAALAAATVFEILTVTATQFRTTQAAAPWQDDPYHVAVSFAVFAIPVLTAVIALRLLAWRAPGGADRERQIRRAAGATLTVIAVTLAGQWIATALHAHQDAWNGWTAALIAGTAIVTAMTIAATVAMARTRLPRREPGPWRSDWLDDAGAIPLLRRWLRPGLAAWVRRHSTGVFTMLSLLAAAGVVGAMVVGERWTDPLLIGWALLVETSSWFSFCVIGTAVAGFVARPARAPARRRAETVVVAGCLGLQVMTAFRDPLAETYGHGPITTVPALAVLTVGAGLAATLLTAAVLAAPSWVRLHHCS